MESYVRRQGKVNELLEEETVRLSGFQLVGFQLRITTILGQIYFPGISISTNYWLTRDKSLILVWLGCFSLDVLKIRDEMSFIL